MPAFRVGNGVRFHPAAQNFEPVPENSGTGSLLSRQVSYLCNHKAKPMQEMVQFVCPIDERVKFQVSAELAIEVPHCMTVLENSKCPYIKAGCIGCRFDKEQILQQRETENGNSKLHH